MFSWLDLHVLFEDCGLSCLIGTRNCKERLLFLFLVDFKMRARLIALCVSTEMLMVMTSPMYTTPSEIQCRLCDQGEYFVSSCTSKDEKANCKPCPSGSYQPANNHTRSSCERCADECPYNTIQRKVQKVTKPCTNASDIKCECEDGRYDDKGGCVNWSACDPGQGVRNKGIVY